MSLGVDTVVDTAIRWILGQLPDADGDGLEDPCDNCPATPNVDQTDADGDRSNACL